MRKRRTFRAWAALRTTATGVLVIGIVSSAASAASDGRGDKADWPCVQPRTSTISAGAIWNGPDPAGAGAWDKDFQAAALAQKLASRRTPLEGVDDLLTDFAAKAGTDKTVRLTHVFAGVLEIINGERDRLLSGIVHYAQGQQKLAEKVRAESDSVSDLQDATDPAGAKARDDAESSLKWDKRIFEERSRSLTYVCESPVLLERRAFDIARRIQQQL